MSSETCLKCGHVNLSATRSETEACPKCGAIYARVKAAMAQKSEAPSSGVPSRQLVRSAPKPIPRAPGLFIDELRSETLYPTFRTVVRLGLFFGYFLVVCAVIGGFMAMFSRDGNLWHMLIGLGGAAILYLLTRIWFELTVMIVDIADASVRTAENSQPRG